MSRNQKVRKLKKDVGILEEPRSRRPTQIIPTLGTILKGRCPCGADMVLRSSKWGYFYGCVRYPECALVISAHRDTGLPMGSPADRETREWRVKAHRAFDRLWLGPKKNRRMSRAEAYDLLQRATGLSEQEAHIARFSIDQCRMLIEALDKVLK